ncbi:hypothetical protein ACLOJK_038882, partial [Asimina triloba]
MSLIIEDSCRRRRRSNVVDEDVAGDGLRSNQICTRVVMVDLLDGSDHPPGTSPVAVLAGFREGSAVTAQTMWMLLSAVELIGSYEDGRRCAFGRHRSATGLLTTGGLDDSSLGEDGAPYEVLRRRTVFGAHAV